MKIPDIYEIFKKYPNIITDSREIMPDSIFVALKGDNFDGNKFVDSAFEKGAAYAIADDKSLSDKENVIVTDDALKTLQELAAYHRKKLGLPVLAITGSNGKTTTKELVHRTLSKKFNIAVTEGNLNNHIGVPKTLLNMKPDNNFAIVEMGTSNFGEIETLCKIANPDFGLITNIGKAHLESFKNIDGVAKAKGELFEFLAVNNGKIFVNKDIDIISKIAAKFADKKNIIEYSQQDCGIKVLATDDKNDCLQFMFNRTKVRTKLVGQFNIDNALAAIATGKYFNISDLDIADAIESYIPENHRSQKIKTQQNILYMDAYNANPTSMQASLQNFINQAATNKMLILGDMLELGASSENEHQNIIKMIAESNISDVLLVGNCFSKAAHNMKFGCFKNVDECIKYLCENKIENRTILIKGSHGIHLEKTEKYL
ncbi:MAG: UDP-N-acetylmuramoyl-tripeptide--D-alanyl-D-alanine ligase [Prevotellaceae bacterium]|jgi:UDP-N-acetylmuramoyl-tripeptide--D-alanyl-D-alanine ligase|nr:UDP-N-acetylmuramoyl-tripeptide--D-alanyl-D-alanine ligase [Prevotellaceae bacterium]